MTIPDRIATYRFWLHVYAGVFVIFLPLALYFFSEGIPVGGSVYAGGSFIGGMLASILQWRITALERDGERDEKYRARARKVHKYQLFRRRRRIYNDRMEEAEAQALFNQLAWFVELQRRMEAA